MFGKGIYFADIVSKSANYCHASKANPYGCLILCEVSLGNSMQKYFADYNANLLDENKHSIKGIGKWGPKEGEIIKEEVFVPNGQIVSTGISNVIYIFIQTSLMYNEYVVYNASQVKMCYLVRFKFIFV